MELMIISICGSFIDRHYANVVDS